MASLEFEHRLMHADHNKRAVVPVSLLCETLREGINEKIESYKFDFAYDKQSYTISYENRVRLVFKYSLPDGKEVLFDNMDSLKDEMMAKFTHDVTVLREHQLDKFQNPTELNISDNFMFEGHIVDKKNEKFSYNMDSNLEKKFAGKSKLPLVFVLLLIVVVAVIFFVMK